jgi:phage gp45-like
MGIRNIAIELVQRLLVKLVDDSGAVQMLQLDDEQVEDDDEPALECEMMLPYGFSSSPPEGSEVILTEVAGDSGQMVALTAQHREYRPRDLQPGEAGLHYLGDFKVYLADDGTVHLGDRAATDFVALASLVDARFDALESKLNDHIEIYLQHIHPHPMGPTGITTNVDTPLTPGDPTGSEVVRAV